MKTTMQTESWKEAVEDYDCDPNVTEVYDEPAMLKLFYTVDGRKQGFLYVPDFLVLTTNGKFLDTWKDPSDLNRQAAKRPYMYCQDEQGIWHCPPAEEAARKYNLIHRIRTLRLTRKIR